MVNNSDPRIVDSALCAIEIGSDGRRKIANGPVYDLDIAQLILEASGLFVVTENGAFDKFDLEMDDDGLKAFILALAKNNYKNSERCHTSARLTKVEWVIDCDAYTMNWNRFAKRAWKDGKKHYVKFGFSEHDPRCLVVSIKK